MELSKALLILKQSSVSLVYIHLVSSVLPGANVLLLKTWQHICLCILLSFFFVLFLSTVLPWCSVPFKKNQTRFAITLRVPIWINQSINIWLVYPISIIYSELEHELKAHYLAWQLMHIFGMHSDHFHRNTTIKLGLFPLLFPGPTWVASALLCTKSNKH